MQNTSRTHSFPALGALLLAFALFALVLAACPAQATAKEYSMPQVDMDISITDAGDVNVVEQRQFDFDGSFTCVWWEFGQIPDNAQIKINGVELRQGSSEAAFHDLSEVAFQTPWRSAGGPGGEAYSFDEPLDTLYVFFEASDEAITVSIDYTVVNGVSAYDDMGEFYWKYITDGWAVDSQNVTATVTLPVPEGETVTPEENAFAWGHGPLNGSVHFQDDGSIIYRVDRVWAGSYAEARVLFPVAWLTNLSDSSKQLHAGSTILDSAKSEEAGWADEANTQRTLSLAYIAFWCILSVALLIWAIVMFFRYGKELRPQFTDQYWRDVPDKDLSPAVIGRLMKWNAEDSSQFTATLMGLSAKGVIRIDKGTYANKRGKMVEDYYLTLLPEALVLVQIDELERKTINLVFGEIAGGENQLWMKSIEIYGKEHPEKLANRMEAWHASLESKVYKAGLFNAKSDSMQTNMQFIAGGYAVLGVGVWFITDNLIQLAPIIPTSIILFVIARFMSQRTRHGAEVAAKAEALKRWLKDFTRLDERPPTDVKVWGQFMVYAFLFGIADQVVRDMRMSVPTFRDMDDATFYSTMPYYYWYSTGSHNAIAASIFDATVSNTVNTAIAAISESSGGGGGGGGFSIGGGGGFGGGGGGGAR